MRTIVLAFLLAITAAGAAPRVSLELAAEARVSDGQVMLGDIARLQSEDLGLVRRLVNLPLGPAPQPGELALVRKEALTDWVRRTTGLPLDIFQWAGADATRVVRSARLLRGQEIADAAIEGLRATMAASGQAAELRVIGSLRDIQLPVGTVRLLPRPMESGVGLRNRALVWVDVWVSDRFVRAFAVSVDIAARTLHGAGVSPPGRDDGRNVSETASADPAAVSRGEWAALRASAGAVSLESRVEVLQDGRVGQRVRVRASSGATGILFAKVVGRGLLELTP